jgi:hypothetical protein
MECIDQLSNYFLRTNNFLYYVIIIINVTYLSDDRRGLDR